MLLKRLLFFTALLFPTLAFAQSTTVSGTITDAGAQTWNNGTYQFTFVPNPAYPNPQSYTWTGGALPQNLTGVLSGTGTYSQSVPSNNAITPQGSSWAAQFCPLATSPCYAVPSITIIGTTFTFSPTPPAIAINLVLPSPGTQRAYSDTEIISAALGSVYYNVTTNLHRACVAVSGATCTTWQNLGSSGPPSGAASGDLNGSYPGPGVVKVNGGAVPTTKTIVGTNASGQIVDASGATLSNPVAVIHNPSCFTITGATPNVSGGNCFVTNNSSATTVTNFPGGVDSQPITVNCGDTNTTISNNANIATFSGSNIVCFANQAYQFSFYSSLSKWVQVGGGSGTPGGAPIQAQFNSSGTFGGSSCANLPTITSTSINFDCDVHPKGLNPYLDVTRYGVRSCTFAAAPCSAGSVTATTIASNPVITVTLPDFIVGDGISLYGAGTAVTMATPGAPTVVPSVNSVLTGTRIVSPGPTGSTIYAYQVFAEQQQGGVTAASPVTTITNGQTLGVQSVNITSCTQSVVTVTCTTASPHGYTVGATGQSILIGGASNSALLGWWTTSNVPDSTHFSFTTNQNTSNGAVTTSTGGNAIWWNCNHLTWAAVTGAYRYWIVGRASGSMATIGVSWPTGINTGAGVITEGVLSWDDFGSSMMGNFIVPPWIPTAPPASAGNNTLTTTVTAVGGGGTSLTLATAPSRSASPVTTVLDATPGILAAQAAAFGPGGTALPIYFPANANSQSTGYVVNSFLDLTSNFNVSLIVNGTLLLNDTMALTHYAKITGYENTLNTESSFAFDSLPVIQVGTANPGIHIINGAPFRMEGVNISGNANGNGALLVVQDFGGANPGSFYKRVELNSGTGNDLMGINLLVRGIPGALSAQLTLDQVLSLPGGPNIGLGITATPGILCTDCAIMYLKHIQSAHRGIFFGIDPVGGGVQEDAMYFQESGTPAISFSGADNNGSLTTPASCTTVFNGQSTMDTTGSPLLWFGPNSACMQLYIEHEGVGALGTNNMTGIPITLISGRSPFSSTQSLGSTWNTVGPGASCTQDGFFAVASGGCLFQSIFYSTMPVAIAPSEFLFVDQVPGPAATLALTTGGTLSTSPHVYQVAPIWQNGGVGKATFLSASITPTSGNQSVIVTWTPVVGCQGYLMIRDGGAITGAPGNGVVNGCNSSTFTDTGYSGGSAGGSFPNAPGGGPTMLMRGTQGIASGGPILSAGTVSAPALNTESVNGAYDNFNRANGAIGSNWTANFNGFNVTSNTVIATAVNSLAFNNTVSPGADQYSQLSVVIPPTTTTSDFVGVSVRNGAASAFTGYVYFCQGNIGRRILRYVGTVGTVLAGPVGTATTPCFSGDILRLEVQGANLVAKYTPASTGITVVDMTATDTTLSTGNPGLFMGVGSVNPTGDNWSGGNLHPITQLDAEQDWVQPQHFANLTIGPTAPITGTLPTTSLVLGTNAFIDTQGAASAPPNPPSGFCRQYYNSVSGFIQGVNSSGGACTAGAISGMTTGQVAIAGSAGTITSSKAIQGTDANILSSGTVSGTAATLCTDANGGATTTGCTGGAISGMSTGQVAIAGSASSITSSKALQGTDANVLTSSTIAAGAGNLLCTDTGSGATTSGCAIFNTQSAATNTNIAATNMVASTSALHSYLFQWTISLTAVGIGCTSSTTINMNAIFTDPNVSTTTTELLGQITIAPGGNGTVGFVAQGTDNILAKNATAVQYSTSGYTAGTGCTTNPTYQVSPTLVQLW